MTNAGLQAIYKKRTEIKEKYTKRDKAIFLGGFFKTFFENNDAPYLYSNFLFEWKEYNPEIESDILKELKMFCFSSASFYFKSKSGYNVFQDNLAGGYIIRHGKESFLHNPLNYLLSKLK